MVWEGGVRSECYSIEGRREIWESLCAVRGRCREFLYYSYANLVTAHYAVKCRDGKYKKTAYMIHAKLYKGLLDGTMTMESFFDNEKVKLNQGHICSYCGSLERITFDHVIPRARSGHDSGDNMVSDCRTCNSPKRGKDLLAWYMQRHESPHITVLRRYLKTAVQI